MSDYLSRIVARNLNLAEVVRPRLWSLFEPPPADGGQVFEENSGYVERDESYETETYPQTSISLSSPLLSDRSADSTLPEEVGTEISRQKAADLQKSIRNKSRPDMNEAEKEPMPETTENIPVAISSPKSKMASGQNQSNYSAAEVKAEPPRTGHRKVDARPLISETIPGQLSPYSNKTETIPATASGEMQRIESPSPTQKTPKQVQPDRQTATPMVTVKTETAGTIRRKTTDSQPPSSETVVNLPQSDLDETKSLPRPQKMETIPTTSGETKRFDSPSSSQVAPKGRTPDQQQKTAPKVTIKTETVLRKAVDDQPLLPRSIPNQPRKESGKAKRQLGPVKAETTIVTAESEIAPTDLRQKESPVDAVEFETARRVRQKVDHLQPRPSEPIQSRPWSDLVRTQRRPGPENATYPEETTENHPYPMETKPASGRVIDRPPKVGIDGERRTVSGRVAAGRELLSAHGSRAAAISPPEAMRLVEPKDSIKPHPTETKPTIQVKIGRVEVHALAPASPPHGTPQPAPKLSLDDYLKQRDGGRP